jgi:SpoVK/Ycf46/Vps4 family AAA+-type ATPase
MGDIDDAQEFAGEAKKWKWDENHGDVGGLEGADIGKKTAPAKPVESPAPGKPAQYVLFRDGYLPTTTTVGALPPDCYEIQESSMGAFASSMLGKSGLLLDLPEMRSNDVLSIVDNFWNSESDYKKGNEFVIGGARFSTGIMIYGPPGSGKSCTIEIASKKLIAREGTVFYSSIHPSTTTEFLKSFSLIEKDRKCIVVLEDIDTQIARYGESLFLEMLDGAKTINNVCFIATTNYPERLDPRIYNRPGRFSHVIKIGLPAAKTREAYLKAILKNHRDVAEIVDKSDGFTIDHLTALVNAVYREKKDLRSEIKRLRALFKMPKAGEQSALGIARDDWEQQ